MRHNFEVVADKPIIHNVHIIDASGSMGDGFGRAKVNTKFDAAIKMVNEEINVFSANTDVEMTYSVVIFSESYEVSQR